MVQYGPNQQTNAKDTLGESTWYTTEVSMSKETENDVNANVAECTYQLPNSVLES